MSEPSKPEGPNEQALLKLYIELTGASEAAARGVMIHTCFQTPTDATVHSPDEQAPPDATPPPPSKA